jgi:hypothetical protein
VDDRRRGLPAAAERRLPGPLQNMQFKTERFGVLFQAADKWDQPSSVVAKY